MKQRIKILHLTASMAVGGAEQLIFSLASRTDPSRFETHTCYLGVPRTGDSLQPKFERLNLPLYITGLKNLYSPQAVLAVRRYVLDQGIDIIHTHLTQADIIGRVVGWWIGRPVISALQNVPHDYNRARFDRRWLERLTARYLATYLVAVSPHIRTMFIQEWGIPEARIGAVFNAVPMEQYLSIPEGTHRPDGDSGPVIINVASLSPQKAQHYLLEAAKVVLEQWPNARFMIVGRGRLEADLKAQAHSLGIADRVIFTGVRYDIPDLLAQADIFVMPSLWEGLPLAAVEAMAAARPVILTDVGANQELIEHGRSGLLIPCGDTPALAGAILSLLNDPSRQTALGRAARTRAREDFSVEKFVKQHEVIYEKLYHNQAVHHNSPPLYRGQLKVDSEVEG